ncbi:MAG: rod shape-determining protein [Bacteroidales bacterium]|nr:rod shape-determining protein [Bacteroidales bacterium]
MSLLSFLTQELAIDLGTANTVIFMNDKIVIDEPSIVAVDKTNKRFIAVGTRAKEMDGRTNPNIQTIRPLKDGVIADFDATEMMIRGFIDMINYKKGFLPRRPRMIVCIPSGSTPVEIRAVRDAAERSGGRDIYLIYEPMAAALGIGVDVTAPSGNMVVDIGGGTTEVAVISLGGIVVDASVKTAGDVFTADIQQYMRQQYNIKIGERTSERIKIEAGAAIADLDEPVEPCIVSGPNLMTVHPVEVSVSSQEIAHCLDKSIIRIESAILSVLEQTPPELYSDIVKKGIFLTGGGALLRGLDKRLSKKINIPFHVAEDPLRAVARGTCIALKNIDRFNFLMR